MARHRSDQNTLDNGSAQYFSKKNATLIGYSKTPLVYLYANVGYDCISALLANKTLLLSLSLSSKDPPFYSSSSYLHLKQTSSRNLTQDNVSVFKPVFHFRLSTPMPFLVGDQKWRQDGNL